MKEPAKRESAEKPTRDKFKAFGTRVMAVPKEEIDKREKAWKKTRPRKRSPA